MRSTTEQMAAGDVAGRPGGQVLRMLVRRWPSLLAVGLIAVNLADWGTGLEYAPIVAISALTYLSSGVFERPRSAWLVVMALLAGFVVVRAAGFSPWPLFFAVGAILVTAGVATGSLRTPGLLRAQAPAAVVFLTAAGLAVAVSPDAGMYLVAAGLIGHAAWDLLHWRADAVVTRSFAEWCGLFDLGLGVAILVMA